jgi:hypothetical protein
MGHIDAAPVSSTGKMTKEERSPHSHCEEPNILVFNSFKKSVLRKKEN